VTARHRREREMLQRLWVATIEEIKLKKKKKRKRFAIECEVTVGCQDKTARVVTQPVNVLTRP
jgi:hypothetical protein